MDGEWSGGRCPWFFVAAEFWGNAPRGTVDVIVRTIFVGLRRREYESDGVKINLILGWRESGGIGDFFADGCLLSGYGQRSLNPLLRYENAGVSENFCLTLGNQVLTTECLEERTYWFLVGSLFRVVGVPAAGFCQVDRVCI